MNDINLIGEYIVMAVVVGCYLVGFVIRNYVSKISNRYIPLIMMILGMVINLLITLKNGLPIDVMTFISGGVSGLASCGVYSMITKSFGLTKLGIVLPSKEEEEKMNQEASELIEDLINVGNHLTGDEASEDIVEEGTEEVAKEPAEETINNSEE